MTTKKASRDTHPTNQIFVSPSLLLVFNTKVQSPSYRSWTQFEFLTIKKESFLVDTVSFCNFHKVRGALVGVSPRLRSMSVQGYEAGFPPLHPQAPGKMGVRSLLGNSPFRAPPPSVESRWGRSVAGGRYCYSAPGLAAS